MLLKQDENEVRAGVVEATEWAEETEPGKRRVMYYQEKKTRRMPR